MGGDPTARHEALAAQIAEAPFPSGVRAPVAVVVLGLVATGVLCLLGPTPSPGEELPTASVAAQQRDTAIAARGIARQVDAAADDLAAATRGLDDDPAATPAGVLAALPRAAGWRGVAVVAGTDGRLLAGRDEPVPHDLAAGSGTGSHAALVGALAGPRAVVARGPGRAGGWRVLASRELAVPALTGAERPVGTYLVAGDGTVVGAAGPALPALEPTARDLLQRRAGMAVRGATGTAASSPPGPAAAPVTLAAYTPVEGVAGAARPAPAVVTLQLVPVDDDDAPPGVAFGPVLLVLALVLAAVLSASVVRPLRRLRRDALAVAAGDVHTEVRVPAVREPARVALALRRCAAQLRGARASAARRPRGPSVTAVVLVVAVALLGWSGALWVASGCDGTDVPVRALDRAREQSQRAADDVGRELLRGRADLEGIARTPAPAGPAPPLSALVARQPRYRSVYTVGPDGRVLSAAGRAPLRAARPLPIGDGLAQEPTAGPTPIVYAYAALPQGGTWAGSGVVAEFDIAALARQVGLLPGADRVVDADMRVVLAGGGFLAFSTVADGAVRSGATRARAGRPSTSVAVVDGAPALLSADPVAVDGLRWTVVDARSIAELDRAAGPAHRHGELAAILVAALAVLLVGWTTATVARPLRRLADTADRIAAGDVHVPPSARRHDEIATVARCLELCRRALAEGPHHLGAHLPRRRTWRPDATRSAESGRVPTTGQRPDTVPTPSVPHPGAPT